MILRSRWNQWVIFTLTKSSNVEIWSVHFSIPSIRLLICFRNSLSIVSYCRSWIWTHILLSGKIHRYVFVYDFYLALVFEYLAFYNFSVALGFDMGAEKQTFLCFLGSWVWLVWACECFTLSWLRYFYRSRRKCLRFNPLRLFLESEVNNYSLKKQRVMILSFVQVSVCARSPEQRWKPAGSIGTGRVDRPVALPVGARFFDRSVKPVEKPVKFSFLATKRHLSTNRNMHTHFIINKSFYKKKNSFNKSHLLKTLAEWFQAFTNMLRPLRNAHPGVYLGGHCAMRTPLWATAQSKTVQNIR